MISLYSLNAEITLEKVEFTVNHLMLFAQSKQHNSLYPISAALNETLICTELQQIPAVYNALDICMFNVCSVSEYSNMHRFHNDHKNDHKKK